MKYSGLSAASAIKVCSPCGCISQRSNPVVLQEGDYHATEEEGKLKVEVAEKMLKWHAESIGRCVELSVPGELPKNVFSLMRTLSDAIGRGYVETALETSV